MAWRRKRERRKIPQVESWGGSKFILNVAAVGWDQGTGQAGGLHRRTSQKSGKERKSQDSEQKDKQEGRMGGGRERGRRKNKTKQRDKDIEGCRMR